MTDDINQGAEDAGLVDRLLAALPAPAVPPALARRILADFDKLQLRWTFGKAFRRIADTVWPDAPAWKPGLAFGLALMLGSGIAAFAPFDIPQQDDAGAAGFALDAAPDVDAGQGL